MKALIQPPLNTQWDHCAIIGLSWSYTVGIFYLFFYKQLQQKIILLVIRTISNHQKCSSPLRGIPTCWKSSGICPAIPSLSFKGVTWLHETAAFRCGWKVQVDLFYWLPAARLASAYLYHYLPPAPNRQSLMHQGYTPSVQKCIKFLKTSSLNPHVQYKDSAGKSAPKYNTNDGALVLPRYYLLPLDILYSQWP